MSTTAVAAKAFSTAVRISEGSSAFGAAPFGGSDRGSIALRRMREDGSFCQPGFVEGYVQQILFDPAIRQKYIEAR
jgi:hypothetical protein